MALIGERIKSARKEKSLTQQELADQLHISRSAISNWENERNYPDLQTIIQLSDILEISLDKLLKEDKVMVKEISDEQRKNKSRKLALRIIIPLFILSLFTTGYLLYQEVSGIQNTFSPSINETFTLEDNSTNWEQIEFNGKEILMFEGMFWNKEIINDVSSDATLEVQISESNSSSIVESFFIEPGESRELNSLDKSTEYHVEVRGENGTYLLNFY